MLSTQTAAYCALHPRLTECFPANRYAFCSPMTLAPARPSSAGLLIKELLIRGDLERCLIVAPGSLVEQWQDELSEKFGLGFDVLTRGQIEASIAGNPFVEKHRLIVRLDMAARSDELKAKLQAAPDWDLIICDEAHAWPRRISAAK